MARAAQDGSLDITVFGGVARSPAIAVKSWLGHVLINDAVEFLFGKKVIVAMKDYVHMIAYE